MALANVSLNDTFLTWMTRFNQSLLLVNLATEGQLNTSGTIKITNPTLLNGGVSLNVANGMIYGNGGLISNLRSSQLSSNNIQFTSNSSTLTVTQTNLGRLGSTVFFDIGTLSTSVNDTAISNIASANSVNTAHRAATSAQTAVATASSLASAAFDKANSEPVGSAAFGSANLALTIANTANAGLANAGGGYFVGNNGARGSIGNKGDIFRIHTANVTANVFISDLERASATGPLYIDPGKSVTVNSGGRLVVL